MSSKKGGEVQVSVRQEEATYRLAGRRTGSALFGLSAAQLVLVCAGGIAAVLTPARARSEWGLAGGLVIAAVCAVLAFCPAGGRPLHESLPPFASFAIRRATGRHRWAAPLPLLTGTPAERGRRDRGGSRALPRCLAGLELLPVDRPGWAGGAGALAPVGLVRDARAGTLTAVVAVRGGQFSLLDPAAQHQRLAGWAQVLSQFARESSPVTRLGWSLWSAPAPLAEHLDWLDGHAQPAAQDGPAARGLAIAMADYRGLVDDAAPAVSRHDLRVWITVDPRRLARRHGRAPDAAEAALAALKTLGDRCRAAGLVVSPPMSPVQIAEAMRVQADPSVVAAMARVRRGLAEHTGLASVLHALDSASGGGQTPAGDDAAGAVDAVHAGPLAVEARWDAVRVDGAWHRVFWVAQWPGLALDPRWLEPLLLAPPCVRTLAVVMEPVSLRASRRRINADSVSIEGQLHLRERHAFRVPVHLQRAHAEVDQREAELHAGFCEYGYLALLAVTGRDLDELDANCHALVDQAAQCGITELRPLYARQDAAWACTLPLGRVPDRELLRGMLT